jgi:hypothetical protein
VYTTVYELNSETLWKSYILGASGGREIVFMLAISLVCLVAAIVRRQPMFLLPILPLALIMSFLTRVLVGESRWGRSLLDQYANGGCQVTEGTTRVQAQQRLEGHSVDRIVIGGVPLEISHFELGPHYRDSIVYGGVLRDGVETRVWYCPQPGSAIGGAGPIVRVDLRRKPIS